MMAWSLSKEGIANSRSVVASLKSVDLRQVFMNVLRTTNDTMTDAELIAYCGTLGCDIMRQALDEFVEATSLTIRDENGRFQLFMYHRDSQGQAAAMARGNNLIRTLRQRQEQSELEQRQQQQQLQQQMEQQVKMRHRQEQSELEQRQRQQQWEQQRERQQHMEQQRQRALQESGQQPQPAQTKLQLHEQRETEREEHRQHQQWQRKEDERDGAETSRQARISLEQELRLEQQRQQQQQQRGVSVKVEEVEGGRRVATVKLRRKRAAPAHIGVNRKLGEIKRRSWTAVDIRRAAVDRRKLPVAGTDPAGLSAGLLYEPVQSAELDDLAVS